MGLEGVLGIIGCHNYNFLMTKQLERFLFFFCDLIILRVCQSSVKGLLILFV